MLIYQLTQEQHTSKHLNKGGNSQGVQPEGKSPAGNGIQGGQGSTALVNQGLQQDPHP